MNLMYGAGRPPETEQAILLSDPSRITGILNTASDGISAKTTTYKNNVQAEISWKQIDAHN